MLGSPRPSPESSNGTTDYVVHVSVLTRSGARLVSVSVPVPGPRPQSLIPVDSVNRAQLKAT